MENFITGFTGHERQHRAAILAVLGKEKYEYFFEKVSPIKYQPHPQTPNSEADQYLFSF